MTGVVTAHMWQLDPDGAWAVWVPDAEGMPGPSVPLARRSQATMPALVDRTAALAALGYGPVDPFAAWTWEEFGHRSDDGPQLVGKLGVLPVSGVAIQRTAE